MKPNYLSFGKLSAFLFVAMLALVSFSCKDDDAKIDCSKLEDQFEDLEDRFEDAIDDEDCDELDDVYSDLIALVKKGKSCDFVEDLMDDLEVDDIDELVDLLEDEQEDVVEACEDL